MKERDWDGGGGGGAAGTGMPSGTSVTADPIGTASVTADPIGTVELEAEATGWGLRDNSLTPSRRTLSETPHTRASRSACSMADTSLLAMARRRVSSASSRRVKECDWDGGSGGGDSTPPPQTLIVLSDDPETIFVPSGENATDMT